MGAIHIAGTWRTTAGPDDVWVVIDDLQTWPRWWPAIREVAPLGDDRARFTFETPSPLRPLVVELSVLDRQPASWLRVHATDGPLSGQAELRLTDDDGVTAVAFDVRLRVRSLLFRPLERILAGATRSGGKQLLREAGDDLAALAGGEPLEHDV